MITTYEVELIQSLNGADAEAVANVMNVVTSTETIHKSATEAYKNAFKEAKSVLQEERDNLCTYIGLGLGQMEVCDMKVAGKTQREIAKAEGVPVKIISEILKRPEAKAYMRRLKQINADRRKSADAVINFDS